MYCVGFFEKGSDIRFLICRDAPGLACFDLFRRFGFVPMVGVRLFRFFRRATPRRGSTNGPCQSKRYPSNPHGVYQSKRASTHLKRHVPIQIARAHPNGTLPIKNDTYHPHGNIPIPMASTQYKRQPHPNGNIPNQLISNYTNVIPVQMASNLFK